MLNKSILMGRLAHDPELKHTQSGTAYTSFCLAVERNYSRQGEERQTDFIDCEAWRQIAEFICKYFTKGQMIALSGSIQTGTETRGKPYVYEPTRSVSVVERTRKTRRKISRLSRRCLTHIIRAGRIQIFKSCPLMMICRFDCRFEEKPV